MAKKQNSSNLFSSTDLNLCSQLIECGMVFDEEIRADRDWSLLHQSVVSKRCDLLGEMGRSRQLANF